jgi:hypothetical protein
VALVTHHQRVHLKETQAADQLPALTTAAAVVAVQLHLVAVAQPHKAALVAQVLLTLIQDHQSLMRVVVAVELGQAHHQEHLLVAQVVQAAVVKDKVKTILDRLLLEQSTQVVVAVALVKAAQVGWQAVLEL